MRHHGWLVLALAGLAFAFAGCGGKEQPPVLLGFAGATTEGNKKIGEEVQAGIELALAEANQSGVAGRKLEMVLGDTASKPEQAKALAKRLTFGNKVQAVLAGDSSESDYQTAGVCQNSSPPVPVLSAASTHARVTQPGNYSFRVGLTDELQGRALAVYAATLPKAGSIVILRQPPADDAGKTYDSAAALADAFTKKFQEKGMVKRNLVYLPKSDEWEAALQVLKSEADRPDLLLLVGRAKPLAVMRDALVREGVKDIPTLCGSGPEADAELSGNEAALEGCWFCSPFCAADPDAASQEFVKRYQAKRHRPPTACSALGYDAARMLFQAMRQANATDPEPVREHLTKLGAFAGVSGPICFDGDRNARRPALIVRLVDGKFKLEKKLAADGY